MDKKIFSPKDDETFKRKLMLFFVYFMFLSSYHKVRNVIFLSVMERGINHIPVKGNIMCRKKRESIVQLLLITK